MRRELKKVVENSLIKANKQRIMMNQHYSEEVLRYIVMKELSDAKLWGRFPNTLNTSHSLVFEYDYKKFQKKRGSFKPDIASISKELKKTRLGKSHPLAVELKITGSLEKDILKCREYVALKKGKRLFDLAVVIATPSHKEGFKAITNVDRLKRRQLRNNIPNNEKKILFGWIDPRAEKPKPEIFWVD